MSRIHRDGRGVTPVIGIVLIVAITVILAAVIGTFAFTAFDRDTKPAPTVGFEFDYDESSGELTVTHESGNRFERANIEFVRGSGGTPTVAEQWPTTVEAGDQTVLSGIGSSDTIRIVWEDPREQGNTATIGRWDGPDS
jgi:flagellin-like protein